MNFQNKNTEDKLVYILIFLLGSIAVTLYIPVIKEVLSETGHHDFQWSPSKIVFERINHYSYMLEGKTEKILMSQYGEYLHGLYILFFPYTLLEWNIAKISWMITNIFLLIYIPLMLCRKFLLSKTYTILIIFFFSSCIVSKVQIITGQQSLLILFFLFFPFVKNLKLNLFLSGISYFKYTIGYSLFFFYLTKKKYKSALLSILPFFFGWIIYTFITKSNLIDTFFQPFQLAVENQLIGETVNNMPKNKFIFSVLENINYFNFQFKSIIFLVLSLMLNIYFIFKISKLDDKLLQLSCLTLSTLIFFPHYPHDYVLLLPSLIYSVKNFHELYSKIAILIIIYFLQFFKGFKLYTIKILNYMNVSADSINFAEYLISYMNILILFSLLIAFIYRAKKYEQV